MRGPPRSRVRDAAGQCDERVLEGRLLHAQALGEDVVACEQRGDRGERVAVAADDDDSSPSRRTSETCGSAATASVVQRSAGAEADDLAGVHVTDERIRGAEGDDPAGVDDGDAVAEALGLLHGVRDEQHGDAAFPDAPR